MLGRVAAGTMTVAVALAVPAAAHGATKEVSAGPFAKQKQFEKALGDGNEYYRRTVTVHKGDKVKWTINGFHSVTFVPKGEDPPPLVLPLANSPVTDSRDVEGNLFWFNNQPNLAFNPLAATPQGGKKLKSGKLTSSGLPLAEGRPKPYTLKFPKTGTFTYLCTVHPGMVGQVRVVGAKKDIPSAKQDKKAAKAQLAGTLGEVKRLSAGEGLNLQNTIQAGNDRLSGATVYKFFPASATFKVGSTVTLQMAPTTSEVHTFTFGPSNGKDLYVDQLVGSLLGPVFDPRGIYPSENPTAGVPSYTPRLHGNGFWNSGFLDGTDASPLPASTQIRFAEAGTFSFICLIHPFMHAEVTVTP